MPDAATFGVFLAAAFALLVIPGPAVAYIVTRSLEHGRAVGIASVLGVATGGVAHVAGAALGVSAILVRSAGAFTAVKLLGAGYLIVLGLRRLLARESADAVANGDDRATNRRQVTPAAAFRQGVIVNVLNPKVALFFLAFLPQFVDASAASPLAQTLMLGFCFLALGTITDGAYAIAAGAIGEVARRRLRPGRAAHRVTGVVYVGLGLAAVATPGSSTPVAHASQSAA